MSIQKEVTNFSLERDIPYFVKQYQNNFSSYQAEKVKQYFENMKNTNIFIKHDLNYNNKPKDLKDDENNTTYQYYLVNHVFILPLKIFIEKLKKGQIGMIQEKIVKILIWSIIEEYNLILYDHQLYHNNISAENILIISKSQKFYFVNNFSSIDVRFINFDFSKEFENKSPSMKKQKDNQDLKTLINELYQLIGSKKIVPQDLHGLTKSLYQFPLKGEDKKQPIFDMSWDQKQSTALFQLFQENKNSVQLTHSVLKAIFLQHFYLNPGQYYGSFEKLTEEFIILYSKIEFLYNTYKNEIINFQNKLNIYINENYKFDHDIIIDIELMEDFDKKVFEKIVHLANFKQGAIYEIEEIVDSEFKRTLYDTKNSIQKHFQQELEIFIYSLYCDLI